MQFPRYLDAPPRFLFWTFNDLIPFAAAALLGILADSLLSGMLIGVVLAWFFRRYQDTKPNGYVQHVAYWYGVLPMSGRTAINSFIRAIYPT